MSPECQEFNRLFSQCVDENKMKDSELAKFDRSPAASVDAPLFVLDKLHELTEGLVSNMNELCSDQLDNGFSLDDMEEFLSREDFIMSEAELVMLNVCWCIKMNVPFSNILHIFNMHDLGPEGREVVGLGSSAYSFPLSKASVECSMLFRAG